MRRDAAAPIKAIATAFLYAINGCTRNSCNGMVVQVVSAVQIEEMIVGWTPSLRLQE